jgi:dTDP-glucose 4,6-dehydratase
MRVVVAGGAGFLGAHLCARLLARGDSVVCVDDLSSGREENLTNLIDAPGFSFSRQDVSAALDVEDPVDAIVNLASPASPRDYLSRPLETLAVGSNGTRNCLELAERHGARFLLASTSEVYGDPQVHPQTEDYWGNVNPIGPRSVYDEAKRFAEALTFAYARTRGTDVAVVRIFNTYGPGLRPGDGRVVSNFLSQALREQPLTVYGDGSQTRSLCFVDDEIDGIVRLLDSGIAGPVNIGNPEETTVLALAERVIALTGTSSNIVFEPLPADDPVRRCPDIARARELLGWEPTVPLDEGLLRTAAWMRDQIE